MFPFFDFEFVHEILISITTERIPETGRALPVFWCLVLNLVLALGFEHGSDLILTLCIGEKGVNGAFYGLVLEIFLVVKIYD